MYCRCAAGALPGAAVGYAAGALPVCRQCCRCAVGALRSKSQNQLKKTPARRVSYRRASTLGASRCRHALSLAHLPAGRPGIYPLTRHLTRSHTYRPIAGLVGHSSRLPSRRSERTHRLETAQCLQEQKSFSRTVCGLQTTMEDRRMGDSRSLLSVR